MNSNVSYTIPDSQLLASLGTLEGLLLESLQHSRLVAVQDSNESENIDNKSLHHFHLSNSQSHFSLNLNLKFLFLVYFRLYFRFYFRVLSLLFCIRILWGRLAAKEGVSACPLHTAQIIQANKTCFRTLISMNYWMSFNVKHM